MSVAPCKSSATGGSTPKSPRTVFLIRTAISESMPSSVNGWFVWMADVVSVTHDGRNPFAQPRGDDPLGLGRIDFAKRVGPQPLTAVAECVQLLDNSCEVAEFADFGEGGGGAIKTQPYDTDPGEVAAHQRLQRLDTFGRSNGIESTERQRARDSHVRPLAPVDRGCGQTRCSSPRDQGIEPRIRAGVRALSRGAQQRGHRREANPPVELSGGRDFVQP